jgi:RNA polymerase sigma-70 factor (ECF subfamily)
MTAQALMTRMCAHDQELVIFPLLKRNTQMSPGGNKPMEQATLNDVLRQAEAGNPDAFAELYRRFYRRVLGLCRFLLNSSGEAEDAASEVFTRLRSAMKAYDSALPFPAWLLSVASHHCLDRLRRRYVEGRIFEPVELGAAERAGVEPSPLEEVLSGEQKETVRAALAELPDRYRIPLALRYYEDLSYGQMALALGVTRGHVGTLLFRAKKELRGRLKKARAEGFK